MFCFLIGSSIQIKICATPYGYADSKARNAYEI